MRDEKVNKWRVTITLQDSSERVLCVDHVVLAFGYPFKWTTFLGQVRGISGIFLLYTGLILCRSSQEDFRGQVIYSADFTSAKDHRGKKVVVIGACASGTHSELNPLFFTVSNQLCSP